ncbi:MAG: hypothetical protein WB615_07060 [Candidatus Tumulicola sp.]
MKISVAALAVGAILLSACSGGSSLSQAPAAGTAPANAVSFPSGLQRAARVQHVFDSNVAEPATVDPDETAAAAYCAKTGGQVYMRQPEYDTNGSNPLILAGRAGFCQYTSASDGSRIHILLRTLYNKKPSLAALAYILKPPSGSCNGNPASCYCTLLGASDQFGGNSGAGGSWVNNKSEDQDLEACIFPDMSSIDSWGLTYNANGVIRGTDLTKVMRYKYPGN